MIRLVLIGGGPQTLFCGPFLCPPAPRAPAPHAVPARLTTTAARRHAARLPHYHGCPPRYTSPHSSPPLPGPPVCPAAAATTLVPSSRNLAASAVLACLAARLSAAIHQPPFFTSAARLPPRATSLPPLVPLPRLSATTAVCYHASKPPGCHEPRSPYLIIYNSLSPAARRHSALLSADRRHALRAGLPPTAPACNDRLAVSAVCRRAIPAVLAGPVTSRPAAHLQNAAFAKHPADNGASKTSPAKRSPQKHSAGSTTRPKPPARPGLPLQPNAPRRQSSFRAQKRPAWHFCHAGRLVADAPEAAMRSGTQYQFTLVGSNDVAADVAAAVSSNSRCRSTILMAATAASSPLLPSLPPARSSACC